MFKNIGCPANIRLDGDHFQKAWLKCIKVHVKALCELVFRFGLKRFIVQDADAEKDIE